MADLTMEKLEAAVKLMVPGDAPASIGIEDVLFVLKIFDEIKEKLSGKHSSLLLMLWALISHLSTVSE